MDRLIATRVAQVKDILMATTDAMVRAYGT